MQRNCLFQTKKANSHCGLSLSASTTHCSSICINFLPSSTHCPRESLLEHSSHHGDTGQRCSVIVMSCTFPLSHKPPEAFLLPLSTQADLTKVAFPEFISRGPTLAQTPDFTESFTLQGFQAGRGSPLSSQRPLFAMHTSGSVQSNGYLASP